eukprot:7359900-Prymnesium_polylepis.1
MTNRRTVAPQARARQRAGCRDCCERNLQWSCPHDANSTSSHLTRPPSPHQSMGENIGLPRILVGGINEEFTALSLEVRRPGQEDVQNVVTTELGSFCAHPASSFRRLSLWGFLAAIPHGCQLPAMRFEMVLKMRGTGWTVTAPNLKLAHLRSELDRKTGPVASRTLRWYDVWLRRWMRKAMNGWPGGAAMNALGTASDRAGMQDPSGHCRLPWQNPKMASLGVRGSCSNGRKLIESRSMYTPPYLKM